MSFPEDSGDRLRLLEEKLYQVRCSYSCIDPLVSPLVGIVMSSDSDLPTMQDAIGVNRGKG